MKKLYIVKFKTEYGRTMEAVALGVSDYAAVITVSKIYGSQINVLEVIATEREAIIIGEVKP